MEIADLLYSLPSVHHQLNYAQTQLQESGFVQLDLTPQKEFPSKFFFRTPSSISAFLFKSNTKGLFLETNSEKAYLAVAKNHDLVKEKCKLIRVECVGNGEWYTWLDRDVRLVGSAAVKENDELKEILIDTEKPIGVISSLAIHLNSGSGLKPSFDKEKFHPIIALDSISEPGLEWILKSRFGIQKLIDFQLHFADTQKGQVVGVDSAFFASGDLSNGFYTITILQAFLQSSIPDEGFICFTFGECDFRQIFKCLSLSHSFSARSLMLKFDFFNGNNPNFPSTADLGSGVYYSVQNTSINFSVILAKLKNQGIILNNFVESNSIQQARFRKILLELELETVFIGIPILGRLSARELIDNEDVKSFSNFLNVLFS